MTHPSMRLRRLSRTVAASVLVMLLTACGGGDPSATDTSALPEGKAARLEVQPAAVMLTAAGERRPLRVRAFDAEGREVRTQVVWRSTRPEQVSIDAAGTVEARSALGATQVIAEADGVQSAPVLVSTVELASGVTLVDDNQIVSDPTSVDPNAEPDPDNPYEVLISGISPPAVGSVLLGRESKAVGGEVLSAQVEGTAVRVRLRLVEVPRMVKNARISEVIDLSRLPLEVPPEIAALYDVKLVGDEHVFTPKAAAAQSLNAERKQALSAGREDGRVRPAKLTEFNLGPFKCEFATPELPLALSQPAQFSLKFEPQLEVDFDDQGLRKLLLKGVLGAKVKTALVINAAGLLNFTCEAKLYKREQKFPGWLGLLLTGELAAGVGFEMEVTASVPLLGVEMTAETKGPFEIGLACATGECRVVREYNPASTFTPKLLVPQTALLRSEAFVFGYGWAKLKTGTTFLENLRADVITARGGVKFEGSFAPVSTQVAPVEVDYRSDYKIGLLAEVAAGSINKAGESAFRKLLLKLGIFKFSTLKTQVAKTLAASPKGSLSMDRDTFIDGDKIAFEVTLDAASIDFPLVGYNVQRVRVFRSVAGTAAREVASVIAQPGQTSLALSWTAEGTTGEGPGEFFAFVDTVLPTPFSLELGKGQVVPFVLSGQVQVGLTKTTRVQNFFFAPTGSTTNSEEVENYSLTSAVEQKFPGGPFLLVDPGYAGSRVRDSTTKTPRKTPPCFFDFVDRSINRTTIGVRPIDLNPNQIHELRLRLERENSWTLSSAVLRVAVASTTTYFFSSENPSGDCSGSDLTPSTRTDPVQTGLGTESLNFSLLPGPAFQGTLAVDAQGRRSLVMSDGLSQTVPGATPGNSVAQSMSVALTLSELPLRSTSADLALTLIAPSLVEPAALVTYAVNLVNRGVGAATVVRAEFNLPPGFAIVGTTGWSGCVTTGTSAVCQALTMAPSEQRAFLIDVKLPEVAGTYTVHGRVSSAEIDANFADNHGQAITEVAD